MKYLTSISCGASWPSQIHSHQVTYLLVTYLLVRFIPNLSFSPDPGTELKLSMDWEQVKKDPDDILDLAEKIAIKAKKKLVLCIDEFQNIAEFKDSLGFQRKLRSHWQLHQHVSYCIYGSKRHMLMEVFSSPSMPFYKFGDLIFLEKIKEEEWITFYY